MQQNCVRDYKVFTVLPRLHQDYYYNNYNNNPGVHWGYNKFALGLHIFVVQELAVIS